MVYLDDTNATYMLARLSQIRDSVDFCDVTFCVEGRRFPAHRVIMVASSQYFSGMFGANFRESSMQDVKIEAITAEAFEQIISHVYNSRVELTVDNVRNVYEAADMLQYDSVKTNATNFMNNQIRHDTCVDYLLVAKRYLLTELEKNSLVHILKHLEAVAQTAQFGDLPMAILKDILDSQELTCDENVVLEVLCNWLTDNPETTDNEKNELIDCVRIALLEREGLDILRTKEDILGEENIQRLQTQLLDFLVDSKEQPLKTGKFALPRGPTCLVVMGGISEQNRVGKNMAIFTMDHGSMTADPPEKYTLPLPFHSSNGQVVTVGNTMFLIGGKDHASGRKLNTIQKLDALTGLWVQLAPMKYARSGHVAVRLGDCILVIGGFGANGYLLKSVEEYNIAQNIWETKHDFPKRIANMAACTFLGKIYVSGGQLGENTHTLTDRMYSYVETRDIWICENQTKRPTSHHMMFEDNTKVFALGGSSLKPDGTIGVSHQVFSFHPVLSETGGLLELGRPRIDHFLPYNLTFFGGCYRDGFMYLVGGHGKRCSIPLNMCLQDIVLIYDCCTKVWTEHPLKLSQPRKESTCAAVILPYKMLRQLQTA